MKKNEVVNDINGLAINFFRVLKTKDGLETIVEIANRTPMARDFWNDAVKVCKTYGTPAFEQALQDAQLGDYPPPQVALAFAYFYAIVNGFPSPKFTSFAMFGASKIKENKVARYWNKVEELPLFCERLKNVIIENKSWEKFDAMYDNPGGLIYFDPPYIGPSRYEYDFHDELFVERLKTVNARAVVSCYDCDLYRQLLDCGYRRYQFDAISSLSKINKSPRIETVYVR